MDDNKYQSQFFDSNAEINFWSMKRVMCFAKREFGQQPYDASLSPNLKSDLREAEILTPFHKIVDLVVEGLFEEGKVEMGWNANRGRRPRIV